MRSHAIPRVMSAVTCALLLVAFVAVAVPSAGPVSASAPPRVTVYVHDYLQEYSTATSEFMAAQFDDIDSPAYGLVSYTVVATLTEASLAGSSALIVDESSDMSLSAADAALIHAFVMQGGKVGLFAYPRFYWTQEAPNPAAVQAVADLFGNAVIGQPAASDLASGNSAAQVTAASCVYGICFTQPYSVAGGTVSNSDRLPFTPITSNGTTAILQSAALGGAAVAVANSNGLLVTNCIGDLVQGSDANALYDQFVVDSIVSLANSAVLKPNKIFLPAVMRP